MSIQRIAAVSNIITQCTAKPSTLVRPKCLQINKSRFISINQVNKRKSLKNEKEKVRMFVVEKYVDYVKNYTKVLEHRFPTAVKMYRVFSIGIKDFLRDLKTYITLRMKMTKDRGFSTMSRQEIELFQRMPSDMWKIAPVLVLSAVPFGNYVIFPLAFMRPKSLLCSHFWSIQQKVEFSRQYLIDRLKNNKPVFRALQAKLESIPDGDLKEKWRKNIALLGSGLHPAPSDIIACKDLFSSAPYELSRLTYSHMGYLLKIHGLKKSILRKNKLKYQAFLILEMDKAIIREGGVDMLNIEALQNLCHLRGLNSSSLSKQEMKDWLQNWLEVSKNVDKSCYSLILHCPIFFAYNHPQNWKLIY